MSFRTLGDFGSNSSSFAHHSVAPEAIVSPHKRRHERPSIRNNRNRECAGDDITAAQNRLIATGLAVADWSPRSRCRHRATLPSAAASEIKYVVNNMPITSYDIQRRAAFLKLQRKPEHQQDGGRRHDRAGAALTEAQRLNIRVTDQQVDDAYRQVRQAPTRCRSSSSYGVLEQAGVTEAAFQGIHPRPDGLGQALAARARGGAGPGGRLTEQEAVQRMLEQGGTKPTATEYMLQQVIFVVPASEQAATLGKRKREAEAMRAAFHQLRHDAAVRQGPGRRDGARSRPRCWRPQLPPRLGRHRSRPPSPAAPRRCARPIAASSSSASARAREVSDDRVAQMVLNSEQNTAADEHREGRRAQQEIYRGAAQEGANRRALTRRSVPRPRAATRAHRRRSVRHRSGSCDRRMAGCATHTRCPPFYLLIGDPELVRGAREAIGQPVKVRTAGAETAARAVRPTRCRSCRSTAASATAPAGPTPATPPASSSPIDRAVDDVLRRPRRGRRHLADRQEGALRCRLPLPGHTEYLAHLATPAHGQARHPGDDAGRPDLAHRARHHPCRARRGAGGADDRGDRRDRRMSSRPILPGASASPAAAGGGGPQSRMPAKAVPSAARRKKSSARRWTALRAEGIDAFGPLPADTMFHARARAGLRCRDLHVSRPGTDPGQDAGLRRNRQRHARPAVRAHLARPRHCLRHRRQGHGPRRQPDRGADAWPQRLAQRSAGTA